MTQTIAQDGRLSRYLGAAFLVQFFASLAGGILSASILSGSISGVLANVSGNSTQMRASIALQLLTSVAIIAMTLLLYAALKNQNRVVALVGVGWWLAEAILLAVATLGTYALLSLGATDQTLGSISLGFSHHAGDIAMLFFCVGGFLWYYLLFRSRLVPPPLSIWGLVSLPTVLVATLMLIWDRGLNPSFALYALYVPVELVVGLWLLIKGGRVRAPGGDAP